MPADRGAMAREVTVGVDIGTTSVKAVAVDGQGEVVARARVPHRLHAPHAGELAHDAAEAWREGPLAAIGEITRGLDGHHPVAGVDVAAMVPSLCAVDEAGHPVSPGLLYGDSRGRRRDQLRWRGGGRDGWLPRLAAPAPSATRRGSGRPRRWPTPRSEGGR